MSKYSAYENGYGILETEDGLFAVMLNGAVIDIFSTPTQADNYIRHLVKKELLVKLELNAFDQMAQEGGANTAYKSKLSEELQKKRKRLLEQKARKNAPSKTPSP